MATQNKFVREMQEAQAEDLRLLAQLSDDLESALKGPQKIKVKEHPKYVEGVTTRQGDEAYLSDLKRFGPMNLKRAFGMNKGMTGVERDVRMELESTLGKSKDLAEYISASTQAICQILMSAAENMTTTTPASELVALKNDLLNISKALTPGAGIVQAIDVANRGSGLGSGEIYNYLYPLNLAYLRAVQAKATPHIQNLSGMHQFIANAEAQKAVLRYLPKHTPNTSVLLPGVIGGNTEVLVAKAFQTYPSKDVSETYAYYQKAVDSEVDLAKGIRVGDVDASLKAAREAAHGASRALDSTGIASEVTSDIKKGLSRAADLIAKISPTKASARTEIALAAVHILDTVGGIQDMGTSSASVLVGGFSGGAFQAELNSLAQNIPSKFAGSSSLSEIDIALLDVQDKLRPSSITATARRKPTLAAFQNQISLALMSLNDAFNEIAVIAPATYGTPVAPRVVSVTPEFKRLIVQQLTSYQNSVNTELSALSANVNSNAFTKGILEAYAQIIGVVQYKDLSGNMVALNSLSVDPKDWDLMTNDVMLNRIADGSIQTLRSSTASGLTVEQMIEDAVNSAIVRTSGTSRIRRATRDAVLRNAQLLVDTLEGLRIQAENIGMPIRQNPASSGIMASDTWWKKSIVGGGALLGDHASASLINRFAKPEAGSFAAHAADYGTSVLTALAGVVHVMGTEVPVLNSEGHKNEALGYSLIGGAVGHAALRYVFKNNVGGARFSENPVLKALQYPTNGVAKALGDMSMGVSACCPANAQDHKKDLAQYLLELLRTNPESAICHISVQLAKSGLVLEDDDDDPIFVASVQSKPTQDQLTLMNNAVKVCMLNFFIRNGVKVKVEGSKITLEGAEKFDGEKLEKAHASMLRSISKILGIEVPKADGFILEPGYNMDVYSGEDRVNYLQPAPRKTSQSGLTQLENAIARAARLSHSEKVTEGVSDVHGDIIRATSETCRMAEEMGMGVSLGRSRKNPHTELFCVEGDNGLMDVTPARQYSVPQGDLSYTKIGHAQNIAVTPNGLFNRGAFGPTFGK